MRAFVRVAAVAAAAGLFLAPAAGVASAARTGPAAARAVQVPIRSGSTRITTIRGIPNLLLRNKIVAFATDPGTETLIDGTAVFGTPPRPPAFRFAFPVSSGQVARSSLRGHISHRGGILLADISNARKVLIGRFTISLSRKTLTGIVNGNPATRFTLFRLDLSHARIHVSGRTIKVTNVGLRITGAAITALDTALGTTGFSTVSKFGTLSSTLHF
jgi:hypothetical protein